MWRLVHGISVLCLVATAVVVYKLKYQSTYEAQHVAKLRNEIRLEREKIASLRAEWGRLSSPERVQDLASRHLGMKPLSVFRIHNLTGLPEKPKGSGGDPIGEMIDVLIAKEETADPLGKFLRELNGGGPATTGSVGRR